jgi:hypothetical protein
MQVPFSQAHFADALGIAPVHPSGTLRRLWDDKLLVWREDCMRFVDRAALERQTRPLI